MTIRHEGSLAAASRALLARLGERPWAQDFYLAGSAALALYTGHRPVRDLDLMSNTNRLAPPERRDLLADLQALDPAVEVETARDGYLFARAQGSDPGVGLRLFYYPYPLVDPLAELAGFAVAAPVDLGLMKIAAIISRGTRRDFVDVYLLCRSLPLPLPDLLARAEEKFGHVRDFPLQALKGLADLTLVPGEPMPALAAPLAWEEVEAWARAEVRELGRAHVGLAR